MIDIEASARAMFDAWHSAADRIRKWDSHPDEDAGPEPGRDTFRMLASATVPLPEPSVSAPVEPLPTSNPEPLPPDHVP